MSEAEVDPITFEICLHKLWTITDEMTTALARVSGSMVTFAARDYFAGLFDMGGNLLMSACGVLSHAYAVPFGVRHVIQAYGEDPGIDEGDAFLINDPYVCALHQSDVYVLSPIHYGGERVGWCATMTHMVDTGSIDPGGFSPRATEVFHEGIRFPGVKFVERGKVRRDILDSIVNMTRDPGMVGLDIRAHLAAADIAKSRVLELIGRYGIDTYKVLCRESIRYAESKLRARLAELPDGTWQAIEYLDKDGRTDNVYKIVLNMTKEGDSLTFDFTGTSEQAPTFLNCGVTGAGGGVFGSLAPLLAHDIPWNQGVIKPIKVIAPEGTVINAKFPAPCSMGSIGGMELAQAPAQVAISKMLNCSEKYKEDFTALWGMVGAIPSSAGVNQYGFFAVTQFLDEAGHGAGARSYADGVDTGGCFWIPTITMPNVETLEVGFPVLFLFRRHNMDSGGAGKFRGGMGIESCFMLRDAPLGKTTVVSIGKGYEAAMSYGLCGGFPSPNCACIVATDTDILEWVSRGDLPQEIAELKGSIEHRPIAVFELTNDDVFYYCNLGGGGYGDPLDRDPELVRRDVVDGAISLERASDLWGVIIDPKTMEVDAEKTRQKRDEITKKRLESNKAL